ncbi:MAG: HlyD family efflux transporter periplasmic adaptor subunit [Psychrosphaera sp.]|nr:HlyD family efflux transporter periplasmic adaptor subunit [Psychrosphaera sp.]
MDKAIDPQVHKQKRNKLFRNTIATVLVLGLSLFAINKLISPSIDRVDVRIAKVEMGEVSTGISASGVVVPRFEQLITSPLSSRIQKLFIKAGTPVTAGDAILQLDSEQVTIALDKLNDQLALKAVEKKALQQNQQRQLRQLHSNKELLEVDLASHKVKLSRYQILYKDNTVSELDVNSAQLVVKKSKIQIRQIDSQMLDIKQQTATDIERNTLEAKILTQQHQEQQQLLADSIVRAPFDGIVTTLTEQLGKTISKGETLAIVANLTSYRINGTLSDLYMQKVLSGQQVKVTVGTELVFGRVSQVMPSVSNGSMQIQVELDEPNLAGLRPNLQVDLEVVTEHTSNSLRVKNGVVFNGGKMQDVFVLRDGVATRQQVKVGMSNTKFVQLLHGVDAGDEIILSDMREYDHLKQIQVQ